MSAVSKMSDTSYNNVHHVCILIFSLLHKIMSSPKTSQGESHFVGSIFLYLNAFICYGNCTVFITSFLNWPVWGKTHTHLVSEVL